jgi:hypothetical protein
MTPVNRHGRATDVAALAERLRGWRDAPLALDVERALAGKSGATGRRAGVLQPTCATACSTCRGATACCTSGRPTPPSTSPSPACRWCCR